VEAEVEAHTPQVNGRRSTYRFLMPDHDREGTSVRIATFAEEPQLVPEVVEIAWREWGYTLPEDERPRWLREAAQDSRLHLPTSAGFVAVDGDRAVGTVQLHEFEIDAIRARSPWVCGMVVVPQYRRAGVGRRLLAALERFAARHGVERLWVFTEDAAGFYERCGWERAGTAVEHGEAGDLLTRLLAP
jgi:GNAT superfamily N-acetyltransferase